MALPNHQRDSQMMASDDKQKRVPGSVKQPRKDRSIGLITEKILDKLPEEPEPGQSWEMSVDQVTAFLNAGRGAVYEVRNLNLLLVVYYTQYYICFIRNIL